jgi:hypothetical protein
MKTIVLFITALASFASSAQFAPMLNENHYWVGKVYGFGTFDYFDHLSGDTVINSMVYKKLYTSYSLEGEQYLIAILREDLDSGRVYKWEGTEKLLYDFSLEQGESVTVNSMGMDQVIEITSVSQVYVGGELRRQLSFNDVLGPAYWIEGVGSSYRPSDSVIGNVADYLPSLSCFYADNALVWSNPLSSLSCELQLEVEGEKEQILQLWPNPCSDKIRIIDGLTGQSKVELFDMTGELLHTEMSVLGNVFEIDTQTLAPGLYSLKLSQDERVYTAKFVKQ